MSDTIRVGLLGCGTVGTGILRILAENRSDIVARLGKPIEVMKILVRDPERHRDPAVPRHLLTTSPDELFAADTHIIVEVLGGYEPARTYLLRALASGRHVVTANKALLARHGPEIFRAADDASRDVIFEGSVGGGIPIIRTLREGLAADRIDALRAIINGTTNYMLTGMAQRGAAYADVLAEAQQKGYAEADPTMDVGGFDAAQKLAILISISFGLEIPFESIRTDGIEQLVPLDFQVARQFGYAVKPLAIAKAHADGIEARVGPTLVPSESLLAHVNGVFNAVMVHSHALGPVLFYGQGAGMMPTASAVVSDIIELGRDIERGTSGRLPHLAFHKGLLVERELRDPDDSECPFYLRFTVKDMPGVIAQLTTVLGAHGISIRRMVQEQSEPGQQVPIVILTHSAREGSVRTALKGIDALPFVTEKTCVLRVEDIP
ncbi:MAG: homoserine dehydrogenase [Myxococcota bacterium]